MIKKLYKLLVPVLAVTLNVYPQGERVKKQLVMVAEQQGPAIGNSHPDVSGSRNRSGFETGEIVKLNGVYHMFVNEMFDRSHRDMRIAYWTSTDAVNWQRQKTILESLPGRSATNPRSEVWVNAVVFNETENAWNIFYVAYRAGNAAKGEIEGFDYEGKIWRAKSIITGKDGIAGPYADMGIVMQPDNNSQQWEGQQAIAGFYPYRVKNAWYAMYAGHTHVPKGNWYIGLASAPAIEGPWQRQPESDNPLTVAGTFMENPIVKQLKNGTYLMVFDSFGNQSIGYSISRDGINWEKEVLIEVQQEHKWAADGDHATRTPLCAIEEEDGSFTVLYTALVKGDKPFYAIGKCTLKWK